MVVYVREPIIPILKANIRDIAGAMIERFGEEAEIEANRRADGCASRGDHGGKESWWRVAATIREVFGATPAGKAN